MKKLIIALAALMVSVAAYGQGQLVFNNRVGAEIDAKFVQADGTTGLTSPEWTVQLLGGPSGTAVGQLQPLTPASTTFRAGNAAGYVTQVTATVPGVAVGANADVLVRLVGPGGQQVDFGPYPVAGLGGVPATGAPITPPNVALGTSVLIVPEPATWALGALGLAALMAIRRRK